MKVIVCLAAIVSLAGCSGGREPTPTPKVEAPAPEVRITQFYANPPAVPKGGRSVLCYGVENAAKVRIEPPVEELSPALTRCFEVFPKATTEYKLIAEGKSGATAESTISVTIGAAAPALFDLSVNKTSVKPGELVTFCFQSRNATSVRGGPGRFQHGGRAAKDCLVHQPSKTTSYEIVVSNRDGLTDRASMTVEVKP